MYEDEMTEANLASTAEQYYAVTRQEKHDEQIAIMRAYVSSLEGMVGMLKRRSRDETMAMLAQTRLT